MEYWQQTFVIAGVMTAIAAGYVLILRYLDGPKTPTKENAKKRRKHVIGSPNASIFDGRIILLQNTLDIAGQEIVDMKVRVSEWNFGNVYKAVIWSEQKGAD